MRTVRAQVYVLQVAQLGGAKLGFAEDPAGAWVDHDVFIAREEAEHQARLHETLPVRDSEGRDITDEVLTAARVVTLEELEAEFGSQRKYQVMTMFRARLSELFATLPDESTGGEDRSD